MNSPESTSSFLFGLERASHNFRQKESLGKNIFTNAFPIALAQFLALKEKLEIPVIEAIFDAEQLGTRHIKKPWKQIIGVNPKEAQFFFEMPFDGYRPYTKGTPNKSDIVAANADGVHTRPFEVKLVVIPNSQTADKPHDEQSCEIVLRPPTIEQLAFSIANSYGTRRRAELLDIIAKCLVNPMDYNWTNHDWMKGHLELVKTATVEVIRNALVSQTPFALTAIWRTQGQKPILEENAFDVFVWTDMAFAQLLMGETDGAAECTSRRKTAITRPERSLVWLLSSLYDYAAQSTLNFGKHHSRITYGTQTDKAGAFAGSVPLKFLRSEEFFKPRITRNKLERIVSPQALALLMPERRLDAVLVTQHLMKQQADQ